MIDASKMSRLSYIRYMYNMAVEQSEKPHPLSAISILLFHEYNFCYNFVIENALRLQESDTQ